MDESKILRFAVDTKHRKDWFTGVSFSHPAKMSLPLQIWCIEQFTKPGDTILDPMAGSGTILVACSLGRNVVAVELEQKFIDIINGNWEKIRQRGAQMGYTLGTATIIQGDARNLSGLVADKIITSPPYADAQVPPHTAEGEARRLEIAKEKGVSPDKVSYLDYTKKLVDKIITSPPYAEALDRDEHKVQEGRVRSMMDYSYTNEKQGKSEGQISNLPYGDVDKIITSPPYGELANEKKNTKSNVSREERLKRAGHNPDDFMGGTARNASIEDGLRYSHDSNNIGNLPYGTIDSVITSPPYEASLNETKDDSQKGLERIKKAVEEGKITGRESVRIAKRGINPNSQLARPQGYSVDTIVTSPQYEGIAQGTTESKISSGFNSPAAIAIIQGNLQRYSENSENIGNLKSTSYLAAMAQVYSECFNVLKPGGLMILIVKSFIRDQKIVDLAADTIKLCEQSGFVFKERWYRELPAQSFWRILYYRKYPSVKMITCEDVLAFTKPKAPEPIPNLTG